MITIKGRSSDILNDLFGDTSMYTKAISLYGRSLDKKYPDEHLSKIFSRAERRTATILPIALCDAFASDLGTRVDKKILAAIGLACVIVATHDDAVDETPPDQKTLASLIYGGDITNLYALKALLHSAKPLVINTFIDALIQNHYLQTRVIDTLWQHRDVSNEQYFDAVKHWRTFCSIGPLCALALTDRMKLKNRIITFSDGYGIAFQLLDDLREVDEDKERGYRSIPIQEGYPYKETFVQIYKHIQVARKSIHRDWEKVALLLNNMEAVVKKLEYGITKS